MQDLHEYLEKNLQQYIEHELQIGYTLDSIKRVLFRHGHHPDMVHRVLNSIDLRGIRPTRNAGLPKKPLEREFYFYIKNLIVQYILEQVSKGYPVNEIRHVLRNHGHDEDIINEAIGHAKAKAPSYDQKKANGLDYTHQATPEKKQPTQGGGGWKKSQSSMIYPLAGFIIALGSIILVAIAANQSLIKVGMVMFPVLLTAVLGYPFSKKLKQQQKSLLFVLAALFSVLFYYMAKSGLMPIAGDISYGKLTVLNLIVSLIVSAVYLGVKNDKQDRSKGDSTPMSKMQAGDELQPVKKA